MADTTIEGIGAAPPLLPLPRQPSPLSLSSAGHGEYFIPSDRSSPVPSVFESEQSTSHFSQAGPSLLPSSSSHADVGDRVPIRSQPDSLIYRTTLKQLESQTVTLKRLAKHVLANLAVMSSVYEQLDKAEDELLGSLGGMSRWLGQGYGLAEGVWDEDVGVRKVRRERRKREKEDLEVMVQQSVDNVRGELKRRGLAGGGATARYEKAQQGYYAQTGAYLAPAPAQHTHIPSSQSTHSLHTSQPSADKAQIARTAQIDSMSYQHHSALLYAVPPSSLVCLDLLVSLHSWAGTLLPDHPGSSYNRESGSAWDTPTATATATATAVPPGLATPARITNRDPPPPPTSLKATLADSLAQMASVRSDLLNSWSLRTTQQQMLEDRASRKQAEVDGTWNIVDSPSVPPGWTGPVTSSASKPKKAHKVHRSVGGRLRDLLSSSSSTYSLAGGDQRGASRASLDIAKPARGRTESVPEHSALESVPVSGSAFPITREAPLPPIPRPGLESRRSVQLDRDYRSPIIATEALPSPLEGLQDDREQVGRKHEGVLWGPGTWEGLGRPNPKAKWEMNWVVLDHSKIYEYSGIDTNQYECQAVIDLRFASVREGRDTERRFVFEVISAKEGRRLYQATSENDMKMWLYAIANAIESCINGTSSVRTFDASKLRTASGALDDHALPARRHKPLGLGFPLPIPPIPATPGNRRSMPPLSQPSDKEREKRTRKASFKNVLKSSGEKWLNRNSTSFDLPRPTPVAASASAPAPGRVTPPPPTLSMISSASPTRSIKESWEGYDDSHDTAIEKKVYEMAGLGLGDSPISSPSQQRRVQSEGVHKHAEGEAMARTRSADVNLEPADRRQHQHQHQPKEEMSMRTLRELADAPGNNRCADCKRPTKASQWATLNLRGVPMVMFLCIRCCGLHRGLGTHVSKPRAINLDHWSAESIALACEWGNERGNAIWERCKPPDVLPNDETMSTYVRDKYVEGKWLSPQDREKFLWPEMTAVGVGVGVGVGRAI